MSPRRVAYIVSDELVKAAASLPSNKNRSFLVHSLASALGLFRASVEPSNLRAVAPSHASRRELIAFHDADYIDYLIGTSKAENSDSFLEALYGLEDDCPIFPNLPQYIMLVAGAGLTSVEVLLEDSADVSISWDGGRHHAHKSRASGFCYVNDCILCILRIRKKSPRPRVMYIDLDLHFSDGVSEAFATTTSSSDPGILTLSIHHHAAGFFPPSSLAALTVCDTSNPFSLSLPLQQGASNQTFGRIWNSCVENVRSAFRPDYTVVQCGVDGLAGDPHGVWNWGLDMNDTGSLGWCIQAILNWDTKVILLGGGGYHPPNAARAWAYLTSIACGVPLSMETPIPSTTAAHLFAPSFLLGIDTGNMPDRNTNEYLNQVEKRFSDIVGRLRALCG